MSKETQQHIPAAMKIARNDLVEEAKASCTPTGHQRPALVRQAAGLPPEPDRVRVVTHTYVKQGGFLLPDNWERKEARSVDFVGDGRFLAALNLTVPDHATISGANSESRPTVSIPRLQFRLLTRETFHPERPVEVGSREPGVLQPE